MTTEKIKRIALIFLLLVGLLVITTASVSATRPRVPMASTSQSFSMVCTYGPTFDLKTADGYITVPDGNNIYMWGYTLATEFFQMPGPVLCVNEGDTVTVNLTNNLDEPVSIIFPGQENVTTSGGSPGLLTAEALPGGSVSYSFVADSPGTFIYESGTNPHKQIQMGLYGALVVRPAMGAQYAYNDAATEFNPEWEYLLLMHDIDHELHEAVDQGMPYVVTNRHSRYWTLNGRSLPDSVAPNDATWLPNQPYSSLLVVEPYDGTPATRALLRFVNAGMDNHPFHPHGNNIRILGQDGRRLQGAGGEDLTYQAFTKSFGAGQTYDALVWWEDVDGWGTQGITIPVGIPSLQNLFFHGGVTWWSGSPYLEEQGELPVGITSYNECGEYYFPWHSHALNEFQNFDEGFGGLATLWRIDPPGGCEQ